MIKINIQDYLEEKPKIKYIKLKEFNNGSEILYYSFKNYVQYSKRKIK